MAAKKKIIGQCRVCGESKPLTVEHYVPKSAGGGRSIKLYPGDELVKSLHKENDGTEYVPKFKIKQNGLTDHTLCKRCNDESGHNYDKDFSNFYMGLGYTIATKIDYPDDVSMEDFLDGKYLDIGMKDVKPFNVAKRILVSFCSVEHPGLTDREPEIRKAIMDKEYKPNTGRFAIFMSLHVGNSAFYGTIAALKQSSGGFVTHAYAGIENNFISFYLTTDKSTKQTGLEDCVDITNWLHDYEYDEIDNLRMSLKFSKSRMIRFPI